jgi:hypothetical protein
MVIYAADLNDLTSEVAQDARHVGIKFALNLRGNQWLAKLCAENEVDRDI